LFCNCSRLGGGGLAKVGIQLPLLASEEQIAAAKCRRLGLLLLDSREEEGGKDRAVV
jgi:hypothetical protein